MCFINLADNAIYIFIFTASSQEGMNSSIFSDENIEI